MFVRRHKNAVSFILGLLLFAMQAHGLLHMLEGSQHDALKGGPSCELCDGVLAAVTTGGVAPVVIVFSAVFLMLVAFAAPGFVPRFSGFSPSLRAPPAVS